MAYLTRTVTRPNGDQCRQRILCTSPIHFRNILADELFTFSGQAPSRLIHNYVPLKEVTMKLGL